MTLRFPQLNLSALPIRPPLRHRHIHKQVQRIRPPIFPLLHVKPRLFELHVEVIGATVVKAFDTELLVAVGVAGRKEHVVDSGGGVFEEGEEGGAVVGVEDVRDGGGEFEEFGAGLGGGEVFGRGDSGVSCEGPGVDDLVAVGVDDFELGAGFEEDVGAGAGGDCLGEHLSAVSRVCVTIVYIH